jgi:HEAT repeat protein
MQRTADVEGLIHVLRYESAVLKREAAAEVLGEIGDEKAVDGLVRNSKLCH